MKRNRGKLDDTLAAMFSNIEYKEYLFYAHILGQCSIKIEKMSAPAGISFDYDHYNLYINPELFDKYKLVERLAILKHEMLHILNGHVQRKEDRNHEIWNYSTDCAINQLIEYSHLPKDCINPDTLGKMINKKLPVKESSEKYYELIKDSMNEQKNNSNNSSENSNSNNSSENSNSNNSSENSNSNSTGNEVSNDSGNPFANMDTHETWDNSKGDKELQTDVTKKMIEQAQNETIKGGIGSVPSECSSWLELHTRKAEVNWRKELRSIVGNKLVGKRSTIMRRDRRFPGRDDLRGKTKERLFNLLVIADVSGSMNDEALLSTLGEVRHICDVTTTPVDLIQIDTQAYEPEQLTKKTSLIKRKGSGGTNLHHALTKAKECKLDFQAVVVLTDGGLFGNDIEYFNNLNKKVIWIIEETGTIMPEMNEGKMKAFKLKGKE